MADPGPGGGLQALHAASVDLDRLARQALSADATARGELARGIDHWVELVEGMVARCSPGPTLEGYRSATQVLETFLARLSRATQAEEVSELDHELPAVVERWSQALTEVLSEVMRSL